MKRAEAEVRSRETRGERPGRNCDPDSVLVFVPIALLLAGLVYEAPTKAPQSSSGGVGWHPLSLLRQVPILGLLPGWTPLSVPLVPIFAAGFYWGFDASRGS